MFEGILHILNKASKGFDPSPRDQDRPGAGREIPPMGRRNKESEEEEESRWAESWKKGSCKEEET